MSLEPAFWAGKRVFVTGHTGFKGSWLLLLLQALGAESFGFSLAPPTTPSMFELLKLDQIGTHIEGDICDRSALAAALATAQPEVVFHMAAQPLVRASYDDPLGTYMTNVMGTAHVLDACRHIPSVKTIVAITTDKCYQNNGSGVPFVEGDALGGHDPYSSSKACSELVASAYRDSFLRSAGVNLATARAGNVIGGGDFAADRLIPDAVRAFTSCVPLKIRNPNATRPWQHVLEPLCGYLLLAQKLSAHGELATGWNFGPALADTWPVGDIADVLVELWRDGAQWRSDDGQHPHEAPRLTLNCIAAHTQLGWTPKLGLADALRLSVDWYQCWNAGGDLTALSKAQINTFLSI
jgi:CDP-glucose 4,6-dehydratase